MARGRKRISAVMPSQVNCVQGEQVEFIDAQAAGIDMGSFIEVSVQDKEKATLEKATLVFSDFSLSIEGKMKPSKLLEILKVLEEV
jgi:hypothetical protein